MTTSGKRLQIAGTEDCSWSNHADKTLLTVTIRTNGGIAVLNDNRGPLTDTQVGEHKSVKQVTPSSCTFFLAVTPTSRVGAQAIKGADPDCTLAKHAAQLVEPKLPDS
jgi:hypothetical protein